MTDKKQDNAIALPETDIELTDKQKLFCLHYLKDLNGTQAAIRAGYSHNSARQIGSENLSKPAIQAYIDVLKADKVNRLQIETDEILMLLLDMARFKITDIYNDDGTLKPISQWPNGAGLCVNKIKVNEIHSGDVVIGETKEIGTIDKKGAIEMLCKYLNLAPDRLEVTGKDGGVIETTFLTPEQAAKAYQDALKDK